MIYNMLTEEDKNKIQSWINCYGTSQGAYRYTNLSELDYILRFWKEHKSEYLFKAFGEQLMLEKEVEYQEPDQDIQDKMAASVSRGKMCAFYTKIHNFADSNFNRWSDEHAFLMKLFNNTNLMNNIISYSPCKSVNIACPDHKTIKLTKGTKTLKALGKLAKALELDKDFEEFRLEHSRILNQRKLKGTLCLSIHPLDYLTMSDNASGWSSCMSWQEDGCYRMGTVEMMNSPMAVVAYMKGSNDLQWDKYTWNNKKWRTLIIVNPESIVSVKAYPYRHDEFTTICIDWLRALVTTNLGWDMHQDVQCVEESVLFNYHGNEYNLSPCTRKMYNDFGAVTHLITLPKKAEKKLPIPLIYCYSGETECMCCGSTESLWDEENFVFCTNCSDGGSYYKECAECGDYTPESEIYWVDDTPVCYHCLDNVAEECQFSGDYHYSENMCTIYLTRQNDVVDVDNDASIRVAKSYLEYCHISEIYCLPHQSANGEWYWNIEDMDFYGLKWYFDILDIDSYTSKKEDENN